MMFHIDAFPVSRPRFLILKETGNQVKMFPSSSGLGHCPFTAVTGVRIPLGIPYTGKLAKMNQGIGRF